MDEKYKTVFLDGTVWDQDAPLSRAPHNRCIEFIEWRTDAEGSKVLVLCGEPIEPAAVAAHLMAAGVKCRAHLEAYHRCTLEEAIEKKRVLDATPVYCRVCGAPGRHIPGEGSVLCDEHNWRQGINRWS